MKKTIVFFFIIIVFSFLSCELSYISCGTHNGQPLQKGPEGGCYYINSNGNKTYVDRSECNCV